MGLGLHSAIHTASTGMKGAEKTINVSGTNLANANTFGYKAERADFASFLSYTYRYGSTPGMIHTAGSNPLQIGMGTEFAGVTTNFTQGTFQEGMTNSDIAINGPGFLIARPHGSNQTFYTRNGALKVNPNFDLTTNTGLYVMGFGIDDQFRIQPGTLTNIKIPINELHIAQATQNTTIAGILDAVGDSATQGTVLQTPPMTDLSKTSPDAEAKLTITQVPRPGVEGYTQTAAQTTAGGAVENGKYVYRFTYVNAAGEESDYSAPTNPLEVSNGQNSVNLSNLPDLVAGASSLRIYRAHYSEDPNITPEFYCVSEIDPAAQTPPHTFVDERSTAAISDPLQPGYRQLSPDRLGQGSYNYYVTYTDALGNESVPTPMQSYNLNGGGGGQLMLSDIPAVDPANNPDGWTGRRVYRSSAAAPTEIHLVGEIRNMDPNATLTDKMPDAKLLEQPALSESGRGNAQINENTRLIDVGKFENNRFIRTFDEGLLTLTPSKGGENLRTATLEITAETTVSDYLNFLNDAYGIRSTADGVPPDQGALGKTINGGAQGATIIDGAFYFLGNAGEKNALEILPSDMRLTPTGGETRQVDLGWGQDKNNAQNAVGVGESTDMVVYDSLGAPVEVRLTMVLESKSNNETVYRWYADSGSNQPPEGLAIATGTGTLRFDQNGKLLSSSNNTISVERTDVASESPLDFDFQINVDSLQALAAGTPEIGQTAQDGAAAGTLKDFYILEDGVIMGKFSSGAERPLGQIPVAQFRNQEGLYKAGDSLYQAGTNSGDPMVVTPGEGTGVSIEANKLELSNSDMGQEIINMILASAMYRANAKVMTTSNEMFDTLLRIT